MNLIRVGLNSSGLGRIPQTQDQVIVGDIERSRTHKVKAIFILGMNDGVFPTINKAEGFLGDKDRENLKEKGIELAKGSLEMLYEDNFSIYKAFTTAEEKLFLSYVSSSTDGTPLRASILINKIRKMYPNLIQESDIINQNEEFIMEHDAFEKLINKLSLWRYGEEIDAIWFEVYNYFMNKEEWKTKLQKAIKALNFKNNPEKILKENIDRLYGNTLNTTVSRLEQYRKCPFSYYLKYGLKVKSNDEFKIQTIDTGTFMHDVIDEFFVSCREKSINIKEISEQEIRKIVDNVIDEKLELPKNYIFTSTDKYKVLTARLKRVILKSMKYIIESLKYSDFEVKGSEIEFKKGTEYEPIIINLDNGKKVEITGKIDRIDIAKTPDGNYIRIIDYKSTEKDIDLNEIIAGFQLQLLTYLDAACKVEDVIPAGVLYFTLKDYMSTDKYVSEEKIEEEIKKKFMMKGLILADVKVVKMMDKTLESKQSNIVPAYIDSKGNLSNKPSVITREQFEDLQKYTLKTIEEISNEILSGDISLKPSYNLKNKKKPCDYCEYKSICNFKVGQNGNNYNYIYKMEKEEVLSKIKNCIEQDIK